MKTSFQFNGRLKTLHVALFLALTAFIACEDPIDVELEEGPRQLVVDGGITDQTPARVNLTTTAPYFDPAPTPRISNAIIRVLEDGETFDVLTESDSLPGLYLGTKTGEIGRTYVIQIDIPEGEAFQSGNWESLPERMRPIFSIDSIYTTFISTPPLPRGDYLNFRVTPGFVFPENTFYRIRRTLNDSAFFQDFLFANNIDDLNSFQFRPVINQVIEEGDEVVLTFSSLSRRYREYLQVLVQQLNPGGLFDPPPAPIRGNVQEQGGEGRVALGYFHASAVVSEQFPD